MSYQEVNSVTLTGVICACDTVKVTPAEIPHQRLWLEHRSRQEELGNPREAQLRIALLFIGESWVNQSQQLEVGQRVQVQGFLARSGYKGEAKDRIQLHVRELQRL